MLRAASDDEFIRQRGVKLEPLRQRGRFAADRQVQGSFLDALQQVVDGDFVNIDGGARVQGAVGRNGGRQQPVDARRDAADADQRGRGPLLHQRRVASSRLQGHQRSAQQWQNRLPQAGQAHALGVPFKEGAAHRTLQLRQRMRRCGLAQANGRGRAVQALQIGNRNRQLQVLEAHTAQDAIEQDGGRQVWHGVFKI